MLTDFDGGSGDEGEAMTAAEVLQKLEEVGLSRSDEYIFGHLA